MKTLLLICLFLSTAQVWGQNVITKTPAAYNPHKNMKVYGARNQKKDTVVSWHEWMMSFIKHNPPLAVDTFQDTDDPRQNMKVYGEPRFTIKDVDRYLSECYAESAFTVKMCDYDQDAIVNDTTSWGSFFVAKDSLFQFMLTHPKRKFWQIKTIHMLPSFDDFKKWLRKR